MLVIHHFGVFFFHGNINMLELLLFPQENKKNQTFCCYAGLLSKFIQMLPVLHLLTSDTGGSTLMCGWFAQVQHGSSQVLAMGFYDCVSVSLVNVLLCFGKYIYCIKIQ